jgi:hypothetical protein
MRVCSVEGCEEPHKARGCCIHHYENIRAGRLPEQDGRGKGYRKGDCLVCDHPDKLTIEAELIAGTSVILLAEQCPFSTGPLYGHLSHFPVAPPPNIGQPCRICAHPEAELIDEMLLARKNAGRRIIPGLRWKDLAARFGLPADTTDLARSHFRRHNDPQHQESIALRQLDRLSRLLAE